MKDATGELSTTVIAVVAIAAILAIFTTLLLPSMRSAIAARMYCQSAVNCGPCSNPGDPDNPGTRECFYYADDNYNQLNGPITCDCE